MNPSRLTALFFLFAPCLSLAQGTKLWNQGSYDDFEKGTSHGAIITSDGHLEPGPTIQELATTPSTFAWSVAAGKDGVSYVATGSPATVLRVDATGKQSTLFISKDLSVQVVRLGADNMIYAATLPSGRVYRLPLNADTPLTEENAQVIFDPTATEEKPHYIWDMAFDKQGRLYLATGAPAAIYRLAATDGKAKPELFYRSDEQHIRVLAFLPDGNLIAGSDGSGLIYRFDSNGKGFVLFDAPRREITSLAIAPDGAIYAASVGDKNHNSLPPIPVQGIVTATITIVAPGSVQASSGSTVLPNGTEIYFIPPGQAPRRLSTLKEDIVYSMAVTPAGLTAGTGNHGRLFRILPNGDYNDAGRLMGSQVLQLVPDNKGGLLAVTANTGRLYSISSVQASQPEYISDVLDAQVFSRWGKVEVAPGTQGAELWTRSGNVENPARGWSDWAKVTTGDVPSPSARFLQWKTTLSPQGKLGRVGVNYLPQNVPPSVDELGITPGVKVNDPSQPMASSSVNVTLPSQQSVSFSPDPNTASIQGTKDKNFITARWSAHDDNGDDLSFTVLIQSEGEEQWHQLKRGLTDRAWSFNSAQVPDGTYRLKVVASDSPSHSPGTSLSAEKISDPFEIDTAPPHVTDVKAALSGEKIQISFTADDLASPIAHAEYAIDAGSWQYIEPVGNLSDSKQEHYAFTAEIPRPDAAPAATGPGQSHLVTVRVYDRYNNVGVGKSFAATTAVR